MEMGPFLYSQAIMSAIHNQQLCCLPYYTNVSSLSLSDLIQYNADREDLNESYYSIVTLILHTILILGDVESACEGDTHGRRVEVTLLIHTIVWVVSFCLQTTLLTQSNNTSE